MIRFLRRFFDYDVGIGDPLFPSTWTFEKAYVLAEHVPVLNPGCLLRPEHGGWRFLFFRWLVFLDNDESEAYYQPLLWVEYFADQPRLMVRVGIPFDVGQGTLLVPLSRAALQEIGLCAVGWTSWSPREDDREVG